MYQVTSQKKSKFSNYLAWLFIVVGVALITISVLLIIGQKSGPKPPPDSLNSAPSSSKPNAASIASYSVPPLNPKYIAIPAINLNKTPVLQLGLLKTGSIAAPNNIYEAGWYSASSRPGQTGAMFIYGHVSSWTANGIFFNLKKLKSGDKVIITRGDNQVFTYQVVSTKIYPFNSVNMGQVLSPVNSGQPGLNLMTCTGQVIKGTSDFNQRLVVFTSLVSS